MTNLFQILGDRVTEWRDNGYDSKEYPAIAEILEFAVLANVRGTDLRQLRFLRSAQLRALEIYWYLRIVEKTPHIFDLYKRHYPKLGDRMDALGIDRTKDEIRDILDNYGYDALVEKIKDDDEFAARMKFESLRETITLDYSSYILALAMGAGKTLLIGTIIATEFAMAMEYPQPVDGQTFVKNALVFAPGKTILGALREIGATPFEKVLPPRFIKSFDANLKLTFTQDGEKDLPIIRGSSFNVIVTNTEKIRIQKSTARRRANVSQLALTFSQKEEEETETANLRLQSLASLPNLGIFSDEAHHTYGQSLSDELKKVRKTVDYLHDNTSVVCVVNTTGTPYYQKQPLKDVVTWYGLSEGIADNVLKEIGDNIYTYSTKQTPVQEFIKDALRNFFERYGKVSLPNGSMSKIAIYFPQNDDLTELRPVIEQTLAEIGQSPTIVLRNTSESSVEEVRAFDRLNDPASMHRVILLVNKGTEGWNCPSLFACVLARKLKTSNNFVLQAGTRCLRQVVGNIAPASIYLSEDNRTTLDAQLKETFGETLKDLEAAKQNTVKDTITLRKLNLPKLVVRKKIREIVESANVANLKRNISFVRPAVSGSAEMLRRKYRAETSGIVNTILQQQGETVIETEIDTIDIRTLAVQLAAIHRIDSRLVYDKLRDAYQADDEMPQVHFDDLNRQLTEQLKVYEETELIVEQALALVRLEGFDKQGEGDMAVYTAEISYQKSRADLIVSKDKLDEYNPNNFGFHYSPYNFDSAPEADFFGKMLRQLNQEPDDIEDLIFLGGLTNAAKTDVFIEYLGEDKKWHQYFPDFLILRKDGKCLIVEIKAANKENDLTDGRTGHKAMAVKKWEDINPDRLKYEIIFADATVPYDSLKRTHEIVNNL